MDGCGWLGERERKREGRGDGGEMLPTRFKLGVCCAGSYKKPGNKEGLLLWQKGLIPALA